jgi:hypothetical protein
MTREGHRHGDLVARAIKFYPLGCDFFFHVPTAIYLLKCAPPQFGHAQHLHWLVIFARTLCDGGKLGEGPVLNRAFLFLELA